MLVRFWGTRGSLPKPGPDTVRYGGNTSCVEIRSNSGTLVVIDCGTGVHGLGQALKNEFEEPIHGHLLISHTHWDHIQGIPFFTPLFESENEWDIYAPHSLSQSIRDTLGGQMQYTYFPVTIEALGAKIRYHDLIEGQFEVGDIKVQSHYLNHPALTLGYRLEVDGVSVVYACDHEPFPREKTADGSVLGEHNEKHVEFLRGADLVIHDAQYTEEEYPDKVGWGHSTVEYAVEVCRAAGVKQLALTHHDPWRDDNAIDAIVRILENKLEAAGDPLELYAAAEGLTVRPQPSADTQRIAAKAIYAAKTPLTPAISAYSILLCATDADTGAMIKTIADEETIQITLAKDTQSALKILDAERPSLIVVDKAAGLEQARIICQKVMQPGIREITRPPVVLLTDNNEIAPELAGFKIDRLVRPFSPEYVRTRLRAWILRTSCRWERARLPHDEEARLAALHGLQILDTEPEERFDHITRLAAEALDVPVAMVSLIDRDRQWFKSCIGIDISETPRDIAFCAHAILENDMLIVPDTFLDPRFADNPVVTGESRVRFYAGCPLKHPNGQTMGTLCLVDIRPRHLDERQLNMLREFARLAEAQLTQKAA